MVLEALRRFAGGRGVSSDSRGGFASPGGAAALDGLRTFFSASSSGEGIVPLGLRRRTGRISGAGAPA
ncbi:MAG: hypothetical protein ACRDJK_02365, partial [Actinomycetota bacterium]